MCYLYIKFVLTPLRYMFSTGRTIINCVATRKTYTEMMTWQEQNAGGFITT